MIERRSCTHIMCFAGVHVVFVLKLVVAAHDCCIFRPDDVGNALHELAKDFEAGFRRQDEWSRPVLSMSSFGLTESHWTDAFDGWYRLVELHGDQGDALNKMKSFHIVKRRMLTARPAWHLSPPWPAAFKLSTWIASQPISIAADEQLRSEVNGGVWLVGSGSSLSLATSGNLRHAVQYPPSARSNPHVSGKHRTVELKMPLVDRCPHTPSTGYAGPAGLAVVRNSVLNLLVGIEWFFLATAAVGAHGSLKNGWSVVHWQLEEIG
jgi:hypothetical protein